MKGRREGQTPIVHLNTLKYVSTDFTTISPSFQLFHAEVHPRAQKHKSQLALTDFSRRRALGSQSYEQGKIGGVSGATSILPI